MPNFDIPVSRPGGDLFESGGPGWHDAMIDVYHPSWTVYAEGYQLAADALIEIAIGSRHRRDFLIYPILFLYRQYLELSLKEIIEYVEELANVADPEPVRGHNLDALLRRLERHWAAASDGSIDQDLAVIVNAARHFGALDPTSENFRYPEKKDGSAVQHARPRVNLPVLQSEMRNAKAAIDIVSGGLSAVVDLHREFLADMGP